MLVCIVLRSLAPAQQTIRAERDALFADAPKATPAMLAAAAASDAREAFPHFHDDEHADFLHRTAGAGYVEITMAMES